MRDLHGLPIRHRVIFKIAMTVYKMTEGIAATYHANDCQLAAVVTLISISIGQHHYQACYTTDKNDIW